MTFLCLTSGPNEMIIYLLVAWSSLEVGDEGWIGPRKKLLGLC